MSEPSGEEDVSPVAADLSGWTPHPSERRDFLNRIRAFPPEVSAWRRHLLDQIREDPTRFRLPPDLDPETLACRLDAGIVYLREVARILAVLYGTPDLGNKKDPTDELVYIILARKTREEAYQKSYRLLKDRFASWDEILTVPRARWNGWSIRAVW